MSVNQKTSVPSKGTRSAATRHRILDAVERLFSEQGYDGASLRGLASAADVPLALLSYHFGTKLDLYRAVWARRMVQSDFHRSFVRPGDRAAPVEHVYALVEHFFAPLANMADAATFGPFLRIIGQEVFDPKQHERGVAEEFLGGQAAMFLDALHEVLPGLSRTEAAIGLRAMIGTAQALFLETETTLRLSRGEADIEDLRSARSMSVDFLVAGWMRLASLSA